MTEILDLHWDADLPSDLVRKLSPEDRHHRVATALKRKVDLLLLWGEYGLPPELLCSHQPRELKKRLPLTRPKLRAWHDPARALWSWVWEEIDHPDGDHHELMATFSRAIGLIKARLQPQKSPVEAEVDTLHEILAARDAQIIELIDRLRFFEEKIQQLQDEQSENLEHAR